MNISTTHTLPSTNGRGIMTRMNFHKSLVICFAVLLLASFANAQTVVGQFDMKASSPVAVAGGEGLMQWFSPQGTILEVPTSWVAENGALRNEGGVDGEGLKPEYETASNKTVRAGVFLVKGNAPQRVRTAIFTGRHVARLANFPNGGEDGEWDRIGPAFNVRIWVGGIENAPFQNESAEWQIVSFLAPSEMPLEKVMICADPFSTWNRSFVGEIKVAILLSGNVPIAAFRGIENALALRHGVPGIRSATEQERRAAQAVSGFSAFGVWGTRVIVR